MTLAEGNTAGPAEAASGQVVESAGGHPEVQDAPKRVIAPLKWSEKAVEARADEGDERTPLERLAEAGRDAAGRFTPKAPVVESVGEEPAAEFVSPDGLKFKSEGERDQYIRTSLGRVSAEKKRAEALAQETAALKARLQQQNEVLARFEEYVKSQSQAPTQAEKPGRVDSAASRPEASASGSAIDRIPWDEVHALNSDPGKGPAFGIALVVKHLEDVFAERERQLVEQIEGKFKPDLGFVSEIRQQQEFVRTTADFIKTQAELEQGGAPKFPELHGDPAAVREFVTEVVRVMDELGELASTPRGFELAVNDVRNRRGIGGRVVNPQAGPAERQSAVLGDSSRSSVGPSVQKMNPAAEISRRIAAANTRTPTGWKFA